MAQFKIFLIAALFIVSSLAGPCKPGYKQVKNCVAKAVDPAGGNCWWGYDTGSCSEIYATSETQCADSCYSCLHCIYEYGCCIEGDPRLYQSCFDRCVAYL